MQRSTLSRQFSYWSKVWIGPYISSGTWHKSYKTIAYTFQGFGLFDFVGLNLIIFSQHYFPVWSLPDANVGYKMLMWTWWARPRSWGNEVPLIPYMDIAMFLICDTGEIIFLQKADSNPFRPTSIHVTHWFTCGATVGDRGKNTRCLVQTKCSPFGQWSNLLWQFSGCCLWGDNCVWFRKKPYVSCAVTHVSSC